MLILNNITLWGVQIQFSAFRPQKSTDRRGKKEKGKGKGGKKRVKGKRGGVLSLATPPLPPLLRR